MNNKLRENSVNLVVELNEYKTDRSDQENNSREFAAHRFGGDTEIKLTIFGHAFSMSELEDISRFATELESIATKALRAEQKIPEGAVFIMKVINNEIEISFGGLSKKQ